MHFCFLTAGSWELNAAQVRVREFGKELIARGHVVSCVVDDFPYNRQHVPAELNNQAAIHFVPVSRGPGHFLERRRIVKRIKPDYVIVTPFIKAYLALRFSGIKIIGDWGEWVAQADYPLLRRLLEKFLDRWLRKASNHILVASRYLQNQFKQRFGLDAAYIPYAAYLPSYPENTASPFSEPTAVYVGNFFALYDHDLLFEAALLLKSRGKTPRIVILGQGPELEKWREFVARHNLTNVSVPGFTSGELLWRHLRHAHVLLFPIRKNLFNLCRCPSKTFAYAQAKRPIITNRVGEVPEVLGDKGTYIECSVDAFADTIQSVMEAPPGADVDYRLEDQNWGARTDALLKVIGGSECNSSQKGIVAYGRSQT